MVEPDLQTYVDAAPYTIACFIVIFNIIGHFGNINLIFVTWKKPSLQTKHGILLSIVCAEHSFCLLGELIQAISGFTTHQLTRLSCLAFMTPYIAVNCCQSMMFLMISLDILISIMFPMRYSNFPFRKYCAIMSMIPICFPIILLIYAWCTISEEQIFLCNPPLALGENGTTLWGGWVLLINVITLVIYAYIYCRVYLNRKKNLTKNCAERRVMKSLSILVVVFCCSWVLCMGSVFFVKYVTDNPLIIVLVQSYVVIFALIAFSQTFYVFYLRSETYRREFRQVFCRTKSSTHSGIWSPTVVL